MTIILSPDELARITGRKADPASAVSRRRIPNGIGH